MRAATAGDRLLARVPAGAELVLEVDLARLRGNAAVGAMVSALVDGGAALPVELPAPLAGADAVLLAAYRIGDADATAITIVEGGTRPAAALALEGGAWALADEGEAAGLLAVAAGGPSAAGDAALLAVRAEAMPAAAAGASVRVAARLDAGARASLAASLDVAPAPATISLWADVADDLAVVARLGDRPAQGATLEAVRDRLAGLAEVRALGLAPAVAEATVAREEAGARGVLVIKPGQLARAVERWRMLAAP